MNNYYRNLCHGIPKGGARPDHKYIKREWRNGRWYYYYEDTKTGRTTVNIEKTNVERAASEVVRDVRLSIDALIHKGSTAITRLFDKPEVKEEILPIGQNYTVDPTIDDD